jgi:hypothetical protein
MGARQGGGMIIGTVRVRRSARQWVLDVLRAMRHPIPRPARVACTLPAKGEYNWHLGRLANALVTESRDAHREKRTVAMSAEAAGLVGHSLLYYIRAQHQQRLRILDEAPPAPASVWRELRKTLRSILRYPDPPMGGGDDA